jgi:hypothetical protein
MDHGHDGVLRTAHIVPGIMYRIPDPKWKLRWCLDALPHRTFDF